LPGLAGTDLIFQWIGMVEYILCYGGLAEHWGLLPATRLASRKILVKQNIKKLTEAEVLDKYGDLIPARNQVGISSCQE
jgi:hypothetical protein